MLLASLARRVADRAPARGGRPVAGERAERSGRGIPGAMSPPADSWAPAAPWSDFVRGGGAVFVVLLALEIFLLGEQGRWRSAGRPWEWRVAGVAIAEWWKYGLTGKHLTAAEVFQDMLVTGLLAASASPMAILQPPASWAELLLLSQTVAAVTALLYHAANAYRLASSGRHLDAAVAALIVGTPYVVRRLGPAGIRAACCGSWATGLTAGTLADQPAVTGVPGTGVRPLRLQRGGGQRAGPGDRRQAAQVPRGAPGDAGRRGRRGRGSLGRGRSGRARPWPRGPSPRLAPHRPDDHPLPGRPVGRGLPHHRHGHGRDPRPGAVSRVEPRASRPGHEEGDGLQRDVHGQPVRPRRARGSARSFRWSPQVPPVARRHALRTLAFPLLKTIIESFDGSPPFFRRVWRNYRNPLLYLRGAVVGLGWDMG